MKVIPELDVDDLRASGAYYAMERCEDALAEARIGVAVPVRDNGRVVAWLVPAGPDGGPPRG
jgi:hypothetical protein